jgi:hypothetical protein
VKRKTYASPESFKRALEQRLRNGADSSNEFVRRRQLLVFDRFLARVTAEFGDAAVLKGGLVLELRLERARTTKDVDLRVTGSSRNVLSKLEKSAALDLGDFMRFEIGRDKDHPGIQNDGMKYDGLRFRAVCRLAGHQYGDPFGVDIAFGDPLVGEPDAVVAEDVLGFAGIAPPKLLLYPVETHIAEKLHAYTLPRLRRNTRVKDLPDIGLLAGSRPFELARLRAALMVTFNYRNTHVLPEEFPEPYPSWAAPYEAMAREDRLPWTTLVEVTKVVQAFLNPVLLGTAEERWNPRRWRWE